MVSLYDTSNFIPTKRAQIGVAITQQSSAFIAQRKMTTRNDDNVDVSLEANTALIATGRSV